MNRSLGGLLSVFLPLSFLTIGGGQAILAEVQRQVVGVHHWMSREEFLQIFAISRMAPGPGSLFITLIGWHVAGVAGAVAATVAIFGPTALLTYVIAGFWSRYENAPWQKALEAGLKPVAAGMILASVYVLITSLSGAPWTQAIALIATATLVASRIHPIMVLSGGALCFLAAHMLFGV